MLRKFLFCTILCSTFFSAMFFLVISKKTSVNVTTEVNLYRAPPKKRELFPLETAKYGIFRISNIVKPKSEIAEQAYARLTKSATTPLARRTEETLSGPDHHTNGYAL